MWDDAVHKWDATMCDTKIQHCKDLVPVIASQRKEPEVEFGD